jgi:CMP/dCMP kinase
MNRSIVINREYGSGGREIGRLIAERTGLEFYDTRILNETAVKQGLSEELLAGFDEQVAAGVFFEFSALAGADPLTASLPYRVHAAISEVILAAAKKGPAVFIGRCADRVLIEHEIALRSVFIYSTDMSRRIARAVAIDGVEPRHAESHIARMDRARRRYQQFFTDTKFGDLANYDLTLNSARLSYETCADVILASC